MSVALYVSLAAGLLLGFVRLPRMLLVALPLAALLSVWLHYREGVATLASLGDFAVLFAVAQVAWFPTYIFVRRRRLRGPS